MEPDGEDHAGAAVRAGPTEVLGVEVPLLATEALALRGGDLMCRRHQPTTPR